MKGSIEVMRDGQHKVVLQDHPPNSCSLPMAPSEMEPELQIGLWLVLLIAVWSVPDQDAIRVALNLAKEFGSQIRIGIRPFDSHEEIAAWCSSVKEKYQTPIWLLLRDGQKLAEKTGIYDEELLKQWLMRWL